MLLVRCLNEPAQGQWFWPGGRLYKAEELVAVAHRVAREELGLDVRIEGRLGVYSHFWETSADIGLPSRHTVNVIYAASLFDPEASGVLDDQHDEYRVLKESEDSLHEYVMLYLNDLHPFWCTSSRRRLAAVWNQGSHRR